MTITTLLSRLPLRIYAFGAVALIMLALIFAVNHATKRAERAERAERQATATTKALDKAATDTANVRANQKEKEDEVTRIEGSDARLPDGFGAQLERVRRGDGR